MTTTNTTKTLTLGEQIAKLAEESLDLWANAVDTCVTPDNKPIPAKRRRAQADADAAETALEAVADAVRDGDIARALEHAEEARTLAREWGDDSTERAILRLLLAAQVEAAPEPTHCQCGEWSGERCAWSGPETETVTVEWMPEQYRGSHTAARNAGVYPANGARHLQVHRKCAASMIEHDGAWCSIVEAEA